jgi:outer membrane receptor protein involved in Fe transport
MVDYSLIRWLRFSGGLRVEHAKLFSDLLSYHQLGYERNDKRRGNVQGYPLINPADINETNLLPSANLIVKAIDNDKAQVNVRLNYNKTLARPSLRELSDATIFDNEFRALIYGNSDLKTVRIDNYDFRLESYFKNGDNVSMSLFYKDFVNHIEIGFGNGGITWSNVGKSTVRGFEFEFRKKLGKHFDFRANATLAKSNSQVIIYTFGLENGIKNYTPGDTINRPMFGQAPYILNGIFGYTADSLGLTATVSYNVQGPRLVITGIIKGRPDVYEIPRNVIDFKISKTLGKHFSTSVTIRDILNQPVRRAYKNNNEGKVEDLPVGPRYFDSFRYGTNYLLSVAYRF